jgi:hypothetical protein
VGPDGDEESSSHFPSIRDSVLSGNATLAQFAVDRVAGILAKAAEGLEAGKAS